MAGDDEDEDESLKAVALSNAASILKARQRTEDDLLRARDALERKTEELALSLSMLKATLDSTTDGILVTDAHFRITSYNQKFVQMWQLPPGALESLDHRSHIRLTAPRFADPAAFEARVLDIYREAPSTTFDLLQPKDGRVIERQSRPQLVDGQVKGRVWTFRDITEQRRTEEALRDESHVLELLSRIGLNLVATLDLKAVVQAVTDASTQITGAQFGAFFRRVSDETGESLQLSALTGASREVFEHFGQPRATGVFGPTLRGEPPVRSDDILNDPRYGHFAPHHGLPPGHLPVRSYLAVPVVARSGDVIGGLFFGHPEPGVFTQRSENIITGIAAQAAVAIDNARLYEAAQRGAEERERLLASERAARDLAERMSALKDDFLATLSHELRTPLSAIMGWIHILRRGAKNPDDVQKGLDTIERNSRAQVQLIDDLLDMNRIASGKVRLDTQPVEPIQFIDAALETVRPAAEGKGVLIERLLDPAVGSIQGDPGRLQQVMTNLLSNSIKFTPRGGKVQVLLERAGSHVAITVADTGIGIQSAFVEHVFERFRQADASTTRQHGGLGLGLSIVKSLVELHGGTVRAASDGEGQGARFSVRLPVPLVKSFGYPQRQPGDSNPPAAPFKPPDLSGLTVLLVDDDRDGRELACHLLSECAARVLVAGSAAEALALFESNRPDVLVSDIGMPGMDGFELLRRLRAMGQERGGRLPAIALTALARSEDRTRALHAGFVAHLSKPVEPPELLATVASAAGRAL